MKVVITDQYYKNLNEERNILGSIPEILIEDHQCKDEDRLCELVKDADAVIVQFAPITRKVIESMKRCKIIARYAVGVDNIDLKAAFERDIIVSNVPDYAVEEVSDHAIALLFTLTRKIHLLTKEVRRGHWSYLAADPLHRMRGKTLGLLGFGKIPQKIAEKLTTFGLNIVCYDPYLDASRAQNLAVTPVGFEELLKEADYISIHCPLLENTKHLIGEEEFRLMKRGVILINTARGEVIDEDALYEALVEGVVSSAALDVLAVEPPKDSNPLLDLANVVITPHSAWYSEDSIQSVQRSVAEEVARVLTGRSPRNSVRPFDNQ